MSQFDVVIVGGGHAGTEAAASAARRGARVCLVTLDRKRTGEMSCNPAIGGLGKGHLVREIDALDGVMAIAADAAAIHRRMLNASKGAAVRGPRIQADRNLYRQSIQHQLSQIDSLKIVEGEVYALDLKSGRCSGVVLADGTLLSARAVVLTTGTFLGGRLFRGSERMTGGRIGERASLRLAAQLRALPINITRLKTGTPPRLDGRTINWARLDVQKSDQAPWAMSFLSDSTQNKPPELSCAITRTNNRTHDIVRAGLDESPLFSGDIEGQGPRYCPSIEDKIFRFGDRDGHQIFLEPEGLDTSLIYPNGLSTSLAADVQVKMVQSIEGLEKAKIVIPGYAVEYDHVDPRALNAQLALDEMPGLFLAGQINGTTGYEEAAAQGLVAGANAAALALGVVPLILDRSESYIGVMIDDLVLQGVTEPYRMLTARAEFRLRLRADNAATRLTAKGVQLGMVGERRRQLFEERVNARNVVNHALTTVASPKAIQKRGGAVKDDDGSSRSLWDWLRFPGVDEVLVSEFLNDIIPKGLIAEMLFSDVLNETVQDAIYAPYLARQDVEVRALQANESITLSSDINFADVGGLSVEMVERLSAARPATLGAASRIRGITPAALAALLVASRRVAA